MSNYSFIENIEKVVFSRFTELVKHDQSKGEIIDMEPASIVRLIASSLISFVAADQLMGHMPGWERETELSNTMQYIMRGIKATNDSEPRHCKKG